MLPSWKTVYFPTQKLLTGFVMVKKCVYCAVRPEFLNIIQVDFSMKSQILAIKLRKTKLKRASWISGPELSSDRPSNNTDTNAKTDRSKRIDTLSHGSFSSVTYNETSLLFSPPLMLYGVGTKLLIHWSVNHGTDQIWKGMNETETHSQLPRATERQKTKKSVS